MSGVAEDKAVLSVITVAVKDTTQGTAGRVTGRDQEEDGAKK